jgi:uncharacterized protein (DUF4415 family)
MYEWDQAKAKANHSKHGVAFADTLSSRHARQRGQRSDSMKANYDFSRARRGAVVPTSGRKVRITIRLDRDIVDWFRAKVEAQGGGNYQTMLNAALRAHTEHQDQSLEKLLRRVVREEIKKAS